MDCCQQCCRCHAPASSACRCRCLSQLLLASMLCIPVSAQVGFQCAPALPALMCFALPACAALSAVKTCSGCDQSCQVCNTATGLCDNKATGTACYSGAGKCSAGKCVPTGAERGIGLPGVPRACLRQSNIIHSPRCMRLTDLFAVKACIGGCDLQCQVCDTGVGVCVNKTAGATCTSSGAAGKCSAGRCVPTGAECAICLACIQGSCLALKHPFRLSRCCMLIVQLCAVKTCTGGCDLQCQVCDTGVGVCVNKTAGATCTSSGAAGKCSAGRCVPTGAECAIDLH
jgi:hypothetical protein